MTTNFISKHVTNSNMTDDSNNIKEFYDCNDSPLLCMIEPKGSVDIIDKDDKTTKEDLEHVLGH